LWANLLRCFVWNSPNLQEDGTTWISTNWFTINDDFHFIEFDRQASTVVGGNNGSLKLWIDNLQQADLTGVDNDTRRIDRARLGALSGVDTGTRGAYYLDAFESRALTTLVHEFLQLIKTK
jgi:hypothetical protein